MTVQVVHARRPLARRNKFSGLSALGPAQFEGYASLFGVPDGAGDRVTPGAFAASLRRRGAGDVRMLYQHFPHAPIGAWEEIAEDARGLYVHGRLSRAVEQREDKRPQLSDLRESGTIEQDSDVVMFIFRNQYYLERTEPLQRGDEAPDKYQQRYDRWIQQCEEAHNKAEVIIAKQRHGPIGNIKLFFEGEFTRFGNLDNQHDVND